MVAHLKRSKKASKKLKKLQKYFSRSCATTTTQKVDITPKKTIIM